MVISEICCNFIVSKYKVLQTIIAMITEDKVTELFCIADDFCKFFDAMMSKYTIKEAKKLKGTELFIGAKYEERFGHVVLCGLGGIFVEVLRDVSSGLAPLSYPEAYSMIRSLRANKIIQGTRGQAGINQQRYAEIIVRLSTLLRFATEIKEMEINPLLADEQNVIAVDARIRIQR